MSFEHRVGDLFEEGDLEAIGQGVNCQGLMGSGIAVAFRTDFPEMHDVYKKLCAEGKLKLGMVWPWFEEDLELTILNMATQDQPGANADLEAVELTLRKALFYCEKKGIKIFGLPRIGAGIGGLAWEDVKAVMERLADESSVHLVIVTHPKDL